MVFHTSSSCPLTYLHPALLTTYLALDLRTRTRSVGLRLPTRSLTASLDRVTQRTGVRLLFSRTRLHGLGTPTVSNSCDTRTTVHGLLSGDRFDLVGIGRACIIHPRRPRADDNSNVRLSTLDIVNDNARISSDAINHSALARTSVSHRRPDGVPDLLTALPNIDVNNSVGPNNRAVGV